MTGQHVFSADTPMALLMAHVGTAPTPPSARCELAIPAALDDIVLSCLAKDPTNRPQSARELADRLSDVPGIGPWTDDQARAWWSSHAPGDAVP